MHENSQLKGLKVAGNANHGEVISDAGVVRVRQAGKLDDFCQKFIESIMAHRHLDPVLNYEAIIFLKKFAGNLFITGLINSLNSCGNKIFHVSH